MLQRSPSYVAAVPYKNPIVRGLEKILPDRWSGPVVRWFAALGSQGFFRFSRRFPGFVRGMLLKGVERELPEGYDIATHFTPRYDPWDQRLCADPEGNLFKAIGRGDASVVTDQIDRFTPDRASACDPARSCRPTWWSRRPDSNCSSSGGMQISVDGDVVDLSSRLTYKGMMLEGVPNLAMAVGYTNASWTLKCDLTCDYVARLLNEMRDRGMTQATPRNHDRKVSPEPMLGPDRRLRAALGAPVPATGERCTVARPPELSQGLSGHANGRGGRRRPRALEPGRQHVTSEGRRPPGTRAPTYPPKGMSGDGRVQATDAGGDLLRGHLPGPGVHDRGGRNGRPWAISCSTIES